MTKTRAGAADQLKAPKVDLTYPKWNAAAVRALERSHAISAGAIAERLWTNLYIRRRTPDEAAEDAAAHYRASTPVHFRQALLRLQ